MNLRDFILPIIIKGLKKFYPSNKKIGIEEVKEYSSYEEAQSVCSKGAQDIGRSAKKIFQGIRV